MEPPGLVQYPLCPHILHVPGPAAPRSRLFAGTAYDRNVGQHRADAPQSDQLIPVPQVPRVARSVDHRHPLARLLGQHGAQHAHVRCDPRARAEHHHVRLGRHLVQGETAGDLGSQEHRIANTQLEEPGRQRSGVDQGDVEFQIFPGHRRRSDRIGPGDDLFRIGLLFLRIGLGHPGRCSRQAQHRELAGSEIGQFPAVGHHADDHQSRGDLALLGDDSIESSLGHGALPSLRTSSSPGEPSSSR